MFQLHLQTGQYHPLTLTHMLRWIWLWNLQVCKKSKFYSLFLWEEVWEIILTSFWKFIWEEFTVNSLKHHGLHYWKSLECPSFISCSSSSHLVLLLSWALFPSCLTSEGFEISISKKIDDRKIYFRARPIFYLYFIVGEYNIQSVFAYCFRTVKMHLLLLSLWLKKCILFYFMFPACMEMHHMHAVPVKARRGHRISELELTVGCSLTMGVLENEPASPERATSVLNHRKQSPQSHFPVFLKSCKSDMHCSNDKCNLS